MKHLWRYVISTLVICILPAFADAEEAPRWIKTPDAAAIARFYPRAAFQSRIEGSAAMDCQIGPGDGEVGNLANCRVSQESPAGMGFGEAVLNMAPLFRMQLRPDRSNVGGWVRIPIGFRLP